MVKKTCHNEYSLNANNLLHISYSIYQYNLAIHDLLTKSSTHSTRIHLYLKQLNSIWSLSLLLCSGKHFEPAPLLSLQPVQGTSNIVKE